VVESQEIVTGRDGSFDVFMDQGWIDNEAFGEKSDRAIAVSEADKANAAISPRTTKGCKIEAAESFCPQGGLVNCTGWALTQLGIAVMLVVKLFEDVRLGAQMSK